MIKVAIKCKGEDHATPVRVYMTREQAWLTIEEAKALEKELKRAIKDAKRIARKWEAWTGQ